MFTPVTITGTLQDAPPATIVAELNATITDGTSALLEGTTVQTTTDANGNYQLDLTANTDPTTTPQTSAWVIAFYNTATNRLLAPPITVQLAPENAPSVPLMSVAQLPNPTPPGLPYVTQLQAGPSITLNPPNGNGIVAVSAPGVSRTYTHTFTQAEAADPANGYTTGAIQLYVPTPGDLLLDAGIYINETFTTGNLGFWDIGTYVNDTGQIVDTCEGIFATVNYGNAFNLSGLSPTGNGANTGTGYGPTASNGGNGLEYVAGYFTLNMCWAQNYETSPPMMFTAPNPLRLIVNTNGRPNSAPIPTGTGNATIYVRVASPIVV